MRIALAQVNPTVGDLKGNAALVVARARQAASQGADLVMFPELVISGYPPEDLVLKDYFLADCREALLQVASACPNIPVLVGVPLLEDGLVYNAAAVLSEGAVVGWYRKILLPNYAVFDEKRYFAPGEKVAVVEMDGVRMGVTICEDIWEAWPALAAATAGDAAVVVNLSMSPYHQGKGREREKMLAERARETGSWICYVNGVGGQDELVFDGHSLVFDPRAELRVRGPQFEEALLIVDVDPRTRVTSSVSAASAPAMTRPVEVIGIRASGRTATRVLPEEGGPKAAPAALEVPQLLSAEGEVYSALCLGVRDYTLKNGFKQVVIGISGGVDSALTASIAADALGADKVNMVSMPSRYSSLGTKSDARETAQRLGAHYYEIPIEDIFASYLDGLAPYLDPAAPGVTEQNIQARIRGNLLMALSNRFGWLVLTTGNKSETAVGYATLYGDMAGGFAVLKDVPKTLVYRLAEYRNALGPGDGPIPESTLRRAPSAELAPDQTDQDTLPPYEILDAIIEGYVVRDDSVEELVALGIDRALVGRVVAMIDGNEYKRRQAAPGVRISPKGFGKDRRLPITNRYRA